MPEEYFENLVSDLGNLELQIHHFSESNITDIFELMNKDDTITQRTKDVIAITIFINVSNFIYKPIKNILYNNTRNGVSNNRQTYSRLKGEVENILKYLYKLCDSSFTENNISMYINLLNDLYINDSPINININNPSVISFIYNHFIKDMDYYLLSNNSVKHVLTCATSFMPMIKVLESYYTNLNDNCRLFKLNAQTTKLRAVFDPLDINTLKNKLTNDINNIKNFNLIIFENYEKILSKTQKNHNLDLYNVSYSLRKIVVLMDYIILSRFKKLLLAQSTNLSVQEENFLNKINVQLDVLSPSKFPKIFTSNERKSFFELVTNILKEPIDKNLNRLPYDRSMDNSYRAITSLYNNRGENDLFPYIFRYGVIEHYSPVLRPVVALYFMMASLLCLKYVSTRPSRNTERIYSDGSERAHPFFITKVLSEFAANAKTYISDTVEAEAQAEAQAAGYDLSY